MENMAKQYINLYKPHFDVYSLYHNYVFGLIVLMMFIPAEGTPRERFDWLLPGESQSPVIYNIKCSSDQFGYLNLG